MRVILTVLETAILGTLVWHVVISHFIKFKQKRSRYLSSVVFFILYGLMYAYVYQRFLGSYGVGVGAFSYVLNVFYFGGLGVVIYLLFNLPHLFVKMSNMKNSQVFRDSVPAYESVKAISDQGEVHGKD